MGADIIFLNYSKSEKSSDGNEMCSQKDTSLTFNHFKNITLEKATKYLDEELALAIRCSKSDDEIWAREDEIYAMACFSELLLVAELTNGEWKISPIFYQCSDDED